MHYECSECGARLERDRAPLVCYECGTAGAIFVPFDPGDDEDARLAWIERGCFVERGERAWTQRRSA